MQATVATFAAEARTGSVLLDNGTALAFDIKAFDVSGLRLLRLGQRVHLELSDTGEIIALNHITFPAPAA